MTPSSSARFALVALLALVVQVGVLDQIVVLGAHPDVMIVLAASAGLVLGAERGATLGFFLGLVADLVLPSPYGLSALAYVFIAFGAGLLRQLPGDRDTRGVQAAACVAVSALGTVLYALLGGLIGQSGMLSGQLVYVTLVVTLGSVVLAVPSLATMRWVQRATERGEATYPVPSGGSAAR